MKKDTDLGAGGVRRGGVDFRHETYLAARNPRGWSCLYG